MAIPRNTVNVSNNKINVVEVISFGPRGPQGPEGVGNNALITASIAGYNLTFTKGDNSQFTLALPQPTPPPIFDTGSLLITASVINDTITFVKGDSSNFKLKVNNIGTSSLALTANTASYVLASNIDTSVPISTLEVTDLTATNFTLNNNLIVTGSITAASFTGDINWSNLTDVPYFVDVEGDIAPNQLAIFTDITTGLPENLPFNLPLGSDGGNPTVKGLSGLTYDGSVFYVQGNVSASGTVYGGAFDVDTLSVTSLTIDQLTGSIDYSHIINHPRFVDTEGDTAANQLAIFADTTTGLPENLPFNLPLGGDDSPSIKGLSGLTFDGSTFEVSGSVKAHIISVPQETGGAKRGIYFNDPGTQETTNKGFIVDGGTYVELGYNTTSSLLVNNNTVRSTAISHRFNASAFKFDNLPTSDPQKAGFLFQTSSAAIGASAGFQVVLISQG